MKKVFNAAFIGFRHGHAISLYEHFSASDSILVKGAFEEDAAAKAEAEQKGVIFTCTSADEILNDSDIDIIVLGGCYADRGAMAIRALKAGKNVFADKPLCTDEAELAEIKRLAAERSLAVGLMLDLRGNNNVLAAERAVESGATGKINNIVFEAQHPLNYGKRPSWYFEKGKHGGTVNDIAVHGIDLVRRFTGSGIACVNSARTWNFYAKQCPFFNDSAQLMVTTASGAGVIGDVSYAAPSLHGYSHPAYWHMRLWGEKGLIDFSAGSDGAALYAADSGEVQILKGDDLGYDYLEDYLSALSDPGYREKYTADILGVTADTLSIQIFADKEAKEMSEVKSILSFRKDKLAVNVYKNRADMGKAAAADIAACINSLLAEKSGINMVFAAAPSQNDMLAELVKAPVDWSRINAFHMDEYVGLSKEHPSSFGNYLNEHIFSLVPFANVYYISDYGEEYSKLLSENHIDIVCLGIGENGHIAFNDPGVADFNDPLLIKKAKLDDVCRMQQVHDGCFPTFDDVPEYALTLTVPQMVSASHMFCVVPAKTKRDAVCRMINDEITEACPATALREHDSAVLYCDSDSGEGLLNN